VKTWHIVVVAAASLILGLGVMWAVMVPKGTSVVNPPAATAESLEREHAATAGNRDAKVHIVEFLDPAC
jgi:hypothetical protein